MKSYIHAALFGAALTAGALGFGAATAHAANDYVDQSAAAVSSELQSKGYAVQFNGDVEPDLSLCHVTSVDGLSKQFRGTAYVTVDCPSSNN